MKVFFPLAALVLAAFPAAAGNRICQTVDGRTHCVEGEGYLACRTVGDRTHCVQGKSPPFEAPPTETPPTEAPRAEVMPDLRMPGGGDVSVRVEGGRVRVRAGGVGIDLDGRLDGGGSAIRPGR